VRTQGSSYFAIPALSVLLLISGCLKEGKLIEKTEIPAYEADEKEQDFAELKERKSYSDEILTFIYYPLPEGNPQHIIDFLSENPNRRMTLIFPPQYFAEFREQFIEPFKVFLSSNQIEIGMTLENE